MTKTTEDLKRALYEYFEVARSNSARPNLFSLFEKSFEEYLEALRSEKEILTARLQGENERANILLDAYRNQQRQTIEARTEADGERNRRQAFEFANKSAGELLIDSRAKVKAQRQSIGKLKNERDNALHTLKVRTMQRDVFESQLAGVRTELMEARKLVGATSVQSVAENVAGDECRGVTAINELDSIEAFVKASIAGFEKFDRENGIK